MPLLEIAAVTKVYGLLRALDGVDVLVEAGIAFGRFQFLGWQQWGC